MEGRKDIADMSFEEFFSAEGKQPAREQAPPKERDVPVRRNADTAGDIQSGFGPTRPKVNVKDGAFVLYVPRYGSDANARFDVAIDCPEGVIPMGQLESIARQGMRQSRATTLNLTSKGISLMEPFKLTIDGEEVFIHKPRKIMFFSNTGIPVGVPSGEVLAVYPNGQELDLVKTEVIGTTVIGDMTVMRARILFGGGIWIKKDGGVPQKEPESPEPVKAEAKPRPRGKRKKAVGSVKIPVGVPDADAVVGGARLPIFKSFPAFRVTVENRDLSECTVSLRDPMGNEIRGKPPVDAPMTFDTDSDGVLEIVLVCEDVELASERFVYIPDLDVERPGGGDLTDETSFGFTAFGESLTADAFGGPWVTERNGTEIAVVWNVPAVTYDIGEGPVRLSPSGQTEEVDIDRMGSVIRLKVSGARKRSLFIGPEKGKKRDLDPEWSDDMCEIDLSATFDEILSSSSPYYTMFITVNSFPMRKLLVIRNPVRIEASFSDGKVHAKVAETGTFECRMYMTDKSVRTVALQPGENDVEVPEDAVEAEVAETRDGRDRRSVTVGVRSLPFLWRDGAGDIWLYISRSKRIPLPDDLSGSKPDRSAVSVWHSRIVRMNPELKAVSAMKMLEAFDRMRW